MNKDIDIISENLSLLNERVSAEQNARELWIRRAIERFIDQNGATAAGIAELLRKIGASSVDDALIAAEALCEKGIGEIHSDITFEFSEIKAFTVSNFCNQLSEKTYRCFFGDRDFKITARDNYIDLFEDVYNERTNFCIVPIENTSSGKLTNFYSLISNYNLKIVKVCNVEHSGQDASTKFALLSAPPINLAFLKKKEYLFDINISSKNGNASIISRALEAAEKCKMIAARIDSVPFTHLKDEYSYQIVFRIAPDASFFAFLVFLLIEGISFTPVGIFDKHE